MKQSIKTGISFGLTSSVITTLGLMIGLYMGTNSRLAVMGGILTIAVADSMSDALGIHMSEESRSSSTKDVWEATISTLLVKFLFSLTFVLPVILYDLHMAVFISIVWGFSALGVLSYYNAKKRSLKPWNAVFEHWAIMTLVVVVSRYIGALVHKYFA